MIYFLTSLFLTALSTGLGIYVIKENKKVKAVDSPAAKLVPAATISSEYKPITLTLDKVDTRIMTDNESDNKDLYQEYLEASNKFNYLQSLYQEKGSKLDKFPAPIELTEYQITSHNGEEICMITMKKLFPGSDWQKVRPDWCSNPQTGRNLELDIYCEELHIAVEYNGSQHYKKNDFFHKDDKQFEDQVYRDIIKKKMCHENNVYLLIVPYWVEKKHIPAFIYCKLIQSI